MANVLWAKCTKCGKEFAVIPDKQRKVKVGQIIEEKASGILVLTCPEGHEFEVDSSDKSRLFIRQE
jgi:hypothetical protein